MIFEPTTYKRYSATIKAVKAGFLLGAINETSDPAGIHRFPENKRKCCPWKATGKFEHEDVAIFMVTKNHP
jgi:hypothetical protein